MAATRETGEAASTAGAATKARAGATFLGRRSLRSASRRLTQMLVLGYGFGTIVLVVGAYNYFFGFGGRTAGWKTVMIVGCAMLLVTMVAPMVWTLPEKLLRRFGNWLGHGIMTVVLLIVYYGFFFPAGALLRKLKGSHPIYEWDGAPPTTMEGWRRKEYPADVAQAARGESRGRVGFFSVMMFFARRGHYFLLPALLVLVSLGIVLFFLQTSALAPFIYTLF